MTDVAGVPAPEFRQLEESVRLLYGVIDSLGLRTTNDAYARLLLDRLVRQYPEQARVSLRLVDYEREQLGPHSHDTDQPPGSATPHGGPTADS